MSIYQETIKEIKSLVEMDAINHKSDVSQFLNRCSEFDSRASGVYATVYNLPDEPDKVVKVCTEHKDGYYLFARWCMRPENKANPHLPSIYREDVIELCNGKIVRFYVIERLTDIMDDGRNITLPVHFHDIDFGVLWNAFRKVAQPFDTEQPKFAHKIQSLDEFVEQIKTSSFALFNKPDNHAPSIVDDDIIDEHESFLETLFDVLTFISPVGMVDLNGNNFMLRGDTVVITDPIAQKYAA